MACFGFAALILLILTFLHSPKKNCSWLLFTLVQGTISRKKINIAHKIWKFLEGSLFIRILQSWNSWHFDIFAKYSCLHLGMLYCLIIWDSFFLLLKIWGLMADLKKIATGFYSCSFSSSSDTENNCYIFKRSVWWASSSPWYGSRLSRL